MFLDDELLEICRKAEINTGQDIDELYGILCTTCEKYYKKQLHNDMPTKQVKVILDRTFNLWDSFVRMAIKEGDKMQVLGEAFQRYTFKKAFLSNEKLAGIYNSL